MKAILITLAATGLIACTGRPVVNVQASPVEYVGRPPTLADVERAILRAGQTQDWKMETVRPGLIVGTRTWSTHVAVVEVTYTAKAYDIRYKDSKNLGYDGTNIHRNYNYHVQELDKGIRAQLLNL
ncbi:MAG: hypothetical protein ACREVS_12125 [Burkholderiales bacterium]